MKRQLTLLGMLLITGVSFAQTDRLWSQEFSKTSSETFENKLGIRNPRLFSLNINGLKTALAKAPKRLAAGEKSEVIISFPNSDGRMESFKVRENSNFTPELAAKYPDIKSYVGQGLEDPNSTVYFSVSPLGLSSMEIYGDKSAVFIEPYAKDLSTYVVYKKSDKNDDLSKFECTVIDVAKKGVSNTNIAARPNADDAKLRTFRLALSCTGEYTAYFGGTKAQALAAMNNTMTRVNGVFEKDFAARMVLIPNNDAVIYTNASTDPYSAASGMSSWNSQLQSTLTSVIGEANYDIGHLFGASGGGGNAGCIGCICTNGSKGSGYTSPADAIPSGDNFDIDYVAHEMGHQFGGNHTFSMNNEGTGANMEPGSGSTIMGYAGITSQDVQPHSDAFFHAISIQQITNNIKAKTCSVNTNTGNSIPTANAGLDYTIPKGTPFVLTGTGTDADGDSLTYIWEQMDNASSSQTGASSAASATKASGPNFRSWTPTTVPTRYFPRMASILAGSTTTAGSEITVEALSSVARTLNFRFTVRDNKAGGSGNNSDDAVITVNSTAGPFAVTSQNAATTYAGGSSQTVTWDVAGTTANGVNTANVDILWSTDNGNTWTTLLSATPNDGSQAVTIPNVSTTTGRIMVKGSNHIFFDVNNANISVNAGSGTPDTVAPTAPTLAASGTTSTSTNLSWSGATDNVGVTGYDVYMGASLIGSTASTTYTVTSLTPSTTYSFSVKAKDAAGNASSSSNTVNVTTLAGGGTVTYCSASASNTTDERIGNVKFGTINNTSTGTAGYEDFTSVSTNVTRGTAYTLSITPVWTSTKYSEAYAVYIDYNGNGSFADSGELVWSKAGSTTSPVTGSVTIPSTAVLGSTRMRVMMKYSSIPASSCEAYTYGQVEDYTINITSSGRGELSNTKDLMTDIKLYPNPVKDIMYISNTTSEDYKIFDMGGKVVDSGKLQRGSVNVSNLIKGAYMIQIGEVSKRFVKN
ncbi:Por secretion system C-terminal sorting domain-containing protein [Chryseobacterium contaminans]|uniref:Por secretion system C-terminal sorting domain-containing protein n=2 Tax=Chryseobacterium contaminans TaxID=1423959 RepID=A0A1M7CTM1_9FLAO|nr:zinc-dependent metalloprotease family protein [Chryseobacterium contaminans]SHL70520.1 Por secretion system C-terminal sorting domain-containing protein [Chryseobacterium contaminans]